MDCGQLRAGSTLESNIQQLQAFRVREALEESVRNNPELALQCALSLLPHLSAAQRAQLAQDLSGSGAADAVI